ncbi:hypothetical protein OKA05_27850 [Luteolibacter arcticus]|uniref:DUF3592 domain-containing protein n=1 Tax=Luteolibacter arcticus TaxID=1581411 RepID=A0ABT3GS89_9BACT|nr:hypothetical protein [Luteolibacter arcticus]MCW1926397.1 hypothetical protein [Luteolibacter arcticus]
MTPRPLHRRVSFWLGLFIACFLGWAWWHSYRYCPGAGVAFAGAQISAARQDGATFVFTPPDQGMARHWIDVEPRASCPDLEDALSTAEGLDVRWMRLPDPLVFLTYLALWTAALAWRQRRLRQSPKHPLSGHQA